MDKGRGNGFNFDNLGIKYEDLEVENLSCCFKFILGIVYFIEIR